MQATMTRDVPSVDGSGHYNSFRARAGDGMWFKSPISLFSSLLRQWNNDFGYLSSHERSVERPHTCRRAYSSPNTPWSGG